MVVACRMCEHGPAQQAAASDEARGSNNEVPGQPTEAFIKDTYAYSKRTRPADANGGMIGADFLIAHGAVIDFGSKTLYLR